MAVLDQLFKLVGNAQEVQEPEQTLVLRFAVTVITTQLQMQIAMMETLLTLTVAAALANLKMDSMKLTTTITILPKNSLRSAMVMIMVTWIAIVDYLVAMVAILIAQLYLAMNVSRLMMLKMAQTVTKFAEMELTMTQITTVMMEIPEVMMVVLVLAQLREVLLATILLLTPETFVTKSVVMDMTTRDINAMMETLTKMMAAHQLVKSMKVGNVLVEIDILQMNVQKFVVMEESTLVLMVQHVMMVMMLTMMVAHQAVKSNMDTNVLMETTTLLTTVMKFVVMVSDLTLKIPIVMTTTPMMEMDAIATVS